MALSHGMCTTGIALLVDQLYCGGHRHCAASEKKEIGRSTAILPSYPDLPTRERDHCADLLNVRRDKRVPVASAKERVRKRTSLGNHHAVLTQNHLRDVALSWRSARGKPRKRTRVKAESPKGKNTRASNETHTGSAFKRFCRSRAASSAFLPTYSGYSFCKEH